MPTHVQLQPTGAKSLLYVMTRDQRVTDNYGLAVAQEYAMHLQLPLIVVFCFLPRVKNRAQEHFDYMLQGLSEVAGTLQEKNIPFVPLIGNHSVAIAEFASVTKPALIVTDFSPLRGVRKWQEELAKQLPLIVTDSHNCVPVWHASNKQEYAARTMRPKILATLNSFLTPLGLPIKHPYAWTHRLPTLDTVENKLESVRRSYALNHTQSHVVPGETAAHNQLTRFIQKGLRGYSVKRNNPTINGLTELSPYLHFGSIGAVTIVRQLQAALAKDNSLQADVSTLIEELVVRKELSDNYCYYNRYYDSLTGAPQWAQDTLKKHAQDPRMYVYSREQFEQATTHDPAWNAAQMQLRTTGKMHGYMRMYWAKKILEWSETPERALETTLILNDFYSIDGGDPNGYVGALWSIAGLHDRPWGERPIYGTVRSMVYNGLKRKFDIQTYIQKYETQST